EPLQAPLHAVKTEFADGVAVRVTLVPGSKLALHTWPQSIPAGSLLAVPVPLPARGPASQGPVAKSAGADRFLVVGTLQVPTPLQDPDHPAKNEVPVGVAVRVT